MTKGYPPHVASHRKRAVYEYSHGRVLSKSILTQKPTYKKRAVQRATAEGEGTVEGSPFGDAGFLAQSQLKQLSRQEFACQPDAQQAVQRLQKKLQFYQLDDVQLIPHFSHGKSGRPFKNQKPTQCHY